MAPEKEVVSTVTRWAAIATVLGILIQVALYTFMAGAKISQKADRAQVYKLERECMEHNVKQAQWEGEVNERLKTIQTSVVRIEEKVYNGD